MNNSSAIAKISRHIVTLHENQEGYSSSSYLGSSQIPHVLKKSHSMKCWPLVSLVFRFQIATLVKPIEWPLQLMVTCFLCTRQHMFNQPSLIVSFLLVAMLILCLRLIFIIDKSFNQISSYACTYRHALHFEKKTNSLGW